MARPIGSKTKPQLRDYIGRKNTQELTDLAVKKAKSGDVVLLKFLLEQIYGKAPQSLDLTSGGEKIPIYNGKSNVSEHNSDNKNIQSNKEN